jgi:hypothetical protein
VLKPHALCETWNPPGPSCAIHRSFRSVPQYSTRHHRLTPVSAMEPSTVQLPMTIAQMAAGWRETSHRRLACARSGRARSHCTHASTIAAAGRGAKAQKAMRARLICPTGGDRSGSNCGNGRPRWMVSGARAHRNGGARPTAGNPRRAMRTRSDCPIDGPRRRLTYQAASRSASDDRQCPAEGCARGGDTGDLRAAGRCSGN